ncbi:MAG: ParA family protein [Chloroflexota bacterium]
MTKIISLAIQKGGVGKTTSVSALSEIMVMRGYRVLSVDMDPQSSLTEIYAHTDESKHVGLLFEKRPEKILNLISENVGSGFDLIPSHLDLAGIEMTMAQLRGNDKLLKTALLQVAQNYDYIFIDSLPGSGKLMDNALTAATHVLIPAQPSIVDLRGLLMFTKTIREIKKHTNRKLINAGVFFTMFDERLILHREAVEQLEDVSDELAFTGITIPRAIDTAVAPGYGESIVTFDPNSKPTKAYKKLADFVETLKTP